MTRKVLIIGLGSIAKRHLKNLKALEPKTEIAVLRLHSKTTHNDYSIAPLINKTFTTLADALKWAPQLALVTNPAALHMDISLALIEKGIHVFIEKPLSHSLEGVEKLKEASIKMNCHVMVAYNFRFYKPLLKMKKAILEGKIGKPLSLRAQVGQYLPSWRPGYDYRESASAKKSLGGGAILELSHEIDYALWLMGDVSQVSAISSRVSYLDMDVEDTAEIMLKFASGALGNLHLDMVDHASHRSCRVVGSEGTLLWNGIDHSLQIYIHDKWKTLIDPDKTDQNEMYVEELKHFLSIVDKQKPSLKSLDHAENVLKVVMAAKENGDLK